MMSGYEVYQYLGRKTKLRQDYIPTEFHMTPRGEREFFDDAEDGLLLGFIMSADDDDVELNLTVWGEEGTPRVINDLTAKEIIRLGIGLAPGDIKETPDDLSPDPHGVPNPVYPWVSRYKTASDTDGTGSTKIVFAVAYTPVVPVHYSRIACHLKNRSSTSSKIKHVRIDRAVFVDQQIER